MPVRRPTELFDRVELAILHDYFGIPRPAALRRVTEDELCGLDLDTDDSALIRLAGRPRAGDAKPLQDAVARLVLSGIQEQLPQWAVGGEDGWLVGRRPRRAARRVEETLTVRLFSINWATSGFACDWPEVYHAARVPWFDRWVVTLSTDTSDGYGTTDLAIGHFADGEPWEDAVRRILVAWWREGAEAGGERFESIEDACAIDDAVVEAWAEEVWPRRVMGCGL